MVDKCTPEELQAAEQFMRDFEPGGVEARARQAVTKPEDVKLRKLRASGMEGDTKEKLGTAVRALKRTRPEQQARAVETLRSQTEEAARIAEEVAGKTARKPGDIVASVRSALRGDRLTPTHEPPRRFFTDNEVLGLENELDEFYRIKKGRVLDATNASEALGQLLDGFPLAKHQLKLLEPIIPLTGREAAGRAAVGLSRQAWSEFIALVNVRRALKASMDVSIVGRQSWLALGVHPIQWMKGSARAGRMLFNPKYGREIATDIFNAPDYNVLRGHKLAIEGVEEFVEGGTARAPISERILVNENAWVNRLLRRLPLIGSGLERSQVSFTVGLAAMRYDIGRSMYLAGRSAGRSAEEITDDMLVLNHITGRGSLGPADKVSDEIAQLAWAPHWLASRIQLPADVFIRSPHARKLAAQALVNGAGIMAGILGAAHLAGAEIELDPRSANWGKMKVGPTRIDVTAGFGPLIRFGVRVGMQAAGQPGMKTDTGDLKDIGVFDATVRLLESKMAPAATDVRDIIKGETFTGERLSWSKDVVIREAIDRTLPFFIDSIRETYEEGGWANVPFAMAEFIGFGVQSYTTSGARMQGMIEADVESGFFDPEDYPELEGRLPRTRGELHPLDRINFDTRHALEIAEMEERFISNPENAESAAFDQSEKTDEDAVAHIERLAGIYGPSRVFREGADAVQAVRFAQKEVISNILEEAGVDASERPSTPGLLQNLYDYRQIFDRYSEAEADPAEREKLQNDIEAFRGNLGRDEEAELDENLNILLRERIPLYAQLVADKRTINDSGYFDRTDAAWEAVRKRALEARGVQLPATVRQHEQQIGPYEALRDPWLQVYNARVEDALGRWKIENPEALFLVIQWGYKSLAKEDIGLLRRAGRDIEQELSPE